MIIVKNEEDTNIQSENDKKSKPKSKVKLTLLIIVLIPISYMIIITRFFTYGWYRDSKSNLHNVYFPWERAINSDGWFRDDYDHWYNRYFSGHQEAYKEWGNMFYNGGNAFKPIIYLYPEQETSIVVRLGKKENVTCSYPKYIDGWNVIAHPDGSLTDLSTGNKLYALYWEGKIHSDSSFDKGFVVKGEDSAKFLEEKLKILGLDYKEAEEFIVYWLPKLECNKYNFIKFFTKEEIDDFMPLEFSVKPDSIIRVLMGYKGMDEYINIPEQVLQTPNREGFVAVEWGGTEL